MSGEKKAAQTLSQVLIILHVPASLHADDAAVAAHLNRGTRGQITLDRLAKSFVAYEQQFSDTDYYAKRLDLSGTNVRDLSPLARMPLERLALTGSPVADFSPVERIATLKDMVR